MLFCACAARMPSIRDRIAAIEAARSDSRRRDASICAAICLYAAVDDVSALPMIAFACADGGSMAIDLESDDVGTEASAACPAGATVTPAGIPAKPAYGSCVSPR